MKKDSLYFRIAYPSLSEEQLNLAIRGRLSVYFNDKLLPLSLNEKSMLIYEQAIKDGFIKQKTKNKEGKWSRATHAYFFWCEAHCRTFIAVMEQGGFSNIRIEFSTATDFGRKNIPQGVYDAVANLAMKYKEPWSSSEIIHVPNYEVDTIVSQVMKETNF